MEPIPVQCNMSGFGGPACTLWSAYDPQTGAVLARKITEYEATRRENCLVVGVDLRTDLDAHFTMEMLGEAIDAYESMVSLVQLHADAMRAKPDGAYETDGFDERGPKRRISGEMSNAKAAMLATCWGLAKQDNTMAAASMMQTIADFHRSTGGGFSDPYRAFTV